MYNIFSDPVLCNSATLGVLAINIAEQQSIISLDGRLDDYTCRITEKFFKTVYNRELNCD